MMHDSGVNAVAFSPDGRTVLTACRDRRARLWDAVTGVPKGEPMRHESEVSAVAFSPDGCTVLTGWGSILSNREVGGAKLWDSATGAPKGEPMMHKGPVEAVAFSPDGRSVVTASEDKTARLWNAVTGGL